MISRIRLDKAVLTEDLVGFSAEEQRSLLTVVNKKLSLGARTAGKPLSGELKGYWRLKAGDCRVVYRIDGNEVRVLVVKLGTDKDDQVYQALLGRLRN